jgi:hypothetical protein
MSWWRGRFEEWYVVTTWEIWANLRDRPFNLKGGGYDFLFWSEFFFRTTQELEYFFLSRKNCFQTLTLGYMTKTLNQIIFFSNIGNQNILLEKTHSPSPLQVKWSFPYYRSYAIELMSWKYNDMINTVMDSFRQLDCA